MIAQSLSLDVIAVAAGAVMGAGIAVRRDFDVMGIIGLAVISGVGGSLLRDLLLQDGTPRALEDWRYGVAVLVGGLVGSFFAGAAQRALPLLLLIFPLGGPGFRQQRCRLPFRPFQIYGFLQVWKTIKKSLLNFRRRYTKIWICPSN